MTLRLIGDIHSQRDEYLKLIKGTQYTLQVGDLDIFHFDWMLKFGVNPNYHKFIGGNHDNYDMIGTSPHNLGDFGVWNVSGFGDIFYLRGAWSIDVEFRTPGLDWWPEEELSLARCHEALALYEEVKPKMLVSHCCPTNVIPWVSDPSVARSWGHGSVVRTRTGDLLDVMMAMHLPRIHVFGHFHRAEDRWVDPRTGHAMPADIDPTDKKATTEYTRIVCLPINGTLDLGPNFVNDL